MTPPKPVRHAPIKAAPRNPKGSVCSSYCFDPPSWRPEGAEAQPPRLDHAFEVASCQSPNQPNGDRLPRRAEEVPVGWHMGGESHR